MKLGIALPNYGPCGTPQNLAVTAKLAENLGYESIWATDHVLPSKLFESVYNHIYEPLTVLAFLASITDRIRLGTSILILPLRNPAVVAKTVASLDSLSGGRMILGIGVGGGEDDRLEFQHVGTNFSDRGKRTDEYIRAMRELWCSPDPRFAGKHVNFADVIASPHSVQPGGPPIWIGGKSDAALARAARIGDGWHPNYIGVEELKTGLAKLGSIGIASKRFTLSLRERFQILKAGEEPLSGGRSSIIGTHDEVRERVRGLSAAGVEHLVAVPLVRNQDEFVEQVNRLAQVMADFS
jgi:probable F420-dependent oxidoreductase